MPSKSIGFHEAALEEAKDAYDCIYVPQDSTPNRQPLHPPPPGHIMSSL